MSLTGRLIVTEYSCSASTTLVVLLAPVVPAASAFVSVSAFASARLSASPSPRDGKVAVAGASIVVVLRTCTWTDWRRDKEESKSRALDDVVLP
ncbi:hypothetical protein C1H46_044687 [Malus baccata]|uniref:Uncharacterized protein n=1 Tax=Malus baccata TaxID=106549 RepID=A0A540K6D8_MALBA|nr:hypothetical protein C1H46_044687 [Malus baccata]